MKKLKFNIKRFILMRKIDIFMKLHKILFINKNIRQYGITTKLIQISLDKKIPIYVGTEVDRKVIINNIIKYSYDHKIDISDKEVYDMVITPNQHYFRGKRLPNYVIVDTTCTKSDLYILKNNGVNIYCGVLYK